MPKGTEMSIQALARWSGVQRSADVHTVLSRRRPADEKRVVRARLELGEVEFGDAGSRRLRCSRKRTASKVLLRLT